jgi:hypothetical protein
MTTLIQMINFPSQINGTLLSGYTKLCMKINGEVIRNTFLSIGYYHPEDEQPDLEAELRRFQMESDVLVDHIDNLGINLVILDSRIERSPNLEDMVEAFLLGERNNGDTDENDLALDEIVNNDESHETMSDMSCALLKHLPNWNVNHTPNHEVPSMMAYSFEHSEHKTICVVLVIT